MCIPSSCHGSGTPVMTRIHHLMGLSPLVVGATQQWSNFGVTSPSAVSILSSHLSQELTVFVMATLMWNQPIVAELFYALKNTIAHIYREPAIAADELVLVCIPCDKVAVCTAWCDWLLCWPLVGTCMQEWSWTRTGENPEDTTEQHSIHTLVHHVMHTYFVHSSCWL